MKTLKTVAYRTGMTALKDHGAARSRQGEEPGEPTMAFSEGPGPAAPRGVRDIWSSENEVKAASLTGPRLQIEGSAREAVQHLLAVADATYAVRGVPQMMTFADVAVRSGAAALKQQLRSSDPDWRFPLRGLEMYLKEAGALPAVRGGMTATRATRVASRMRELPAFDGQGFVASVALGADGGATPKYASDPRRAMTAYDYFVETNPGFDEMLLNSITQAKTTPKTSLRDARLSMIQRTIPDVGAALLLRALDQEGYKEDAHETPRASFAYPDNRFLIWAEHVMLDLRRVLDEKDLKIRGEVYSLQVTSPTGEKYTADSYEALLRALEPIEYSAKTATVEARKEAERRFEANKEHFRALRAEFVALQKGIEPRQQGAVAAADLLIAFIRHAFDVKTWQRKARSLDTSEGQAGERRPGRKPEAPRPAHGWGPDEFSYQEESAPEGQAAPAEQVANDDDGEFVFTVPSFNMSWVDLQEVNVKTEVEAHGIGGWRVFREPTVYPGVLWKVIAGPMFFALDFDKEETYDQMVVIAPKREGGGPDTSPAAIRVIRLADYVSYFGPAQQAGDEA